MVATAEALQKDANIAKIAAEFQKLCIQHTTNTKNILTCTGLWPSDIYNVPEELKNRIGSIISFLQENKALFCEEDEYLLLYNLQNIPRLDESSPFFFILQLRIISEEETADLSTFNQGRALSLTIDEKGNIGHGGYALEMMEYYESGVLRMDASEPYDNLYNYSDPMPLASKTQSYSLTEKLVTLTSILSDCNERQKADVQTETSDSGLDFDLSVTYVFDRSILGVALKHFDVSSEMPSPSSPFSIRMEGNSTRYLEMANYLDCRA